jgi:anti-sigma factor RsiW
MSVSRQVLMRYHDQELSESEALAVAAEVERDPELAEEIAAYAELGSFVRAWGEARSAEHVDLVDDIMLAIEPPAHKFAKVSPIRVHAPRIVAWVSLAAAVAAGAVLVARSWSADPNAARGAGADGSVAVTTSASAAEPTEPPAPPVAIESVDFGTKGGTVFVVSTDSAETPVVWTTDDDESASGESEDRNEPL